MKHILQISILLFSILSVAQVERTSELFLQMKQLDSIVFDAGFNNCNLKALEAILSEDLEFYHDIGGIQNKTEFLNAMANNICGDPSALYTRKLVTGSLQVFPLKSKDTIYGALQRGEHEFYRQETNQTNLKTGYAKFTSYWELQDGAWKLKRVFSFDHRAEE